MKTDVAGLVDEGSAVNAVAAEDTSEDMHRGENASGLAMTHGSAVALVVAEIGIEDLTFENISRHAQAIAPASLDHQIAKAEIVKIASLPIDIEHEAASLPALAANAQAFDDEEPCRCMARDAQDVGAVVDFREKNRAMSVDGRLLDRLSLFISLQID